MMATLHRGMTEPEWIDFGRSWDDFENDGLNAMGTEVELVEEYDRHHGIIGAPDSWTEARIRRWRELIGSINSNSGPCNCCVESLQAMVAD